MECLFHQLVNKHIIFQFYLEEQVTLIYVFRAFYNPLSVSHVFIVRMWFNAYSSLINTSLFNSSFYKVNTLQNKLVKKKLLI